MNDPTKTALSGTHNQKNNIIDREKGLRQTRSEVQYNWSGRDVFLISAGITLAFLAVIVGYRLYTNIAIPESTQHAAPAIWTSLGLGLLEGIILISCVYYLGLKRRGLSWATAGIRPLTPEWLFKGLSLGILVLGSVKLRQIVQVCCNIGVVWPKGLLIYCQSPLEKGLGLCILALRLINPRQIAQGCPHMGVVWPKSFLRYFQ